jgi:hypothetical protein
MIGSKKLISVRQELQRALVATRDDPICWLEACMTSPERHGSVASGQSEVLHALQRFLEATDREKRRTRRAGTKK